jgi:hypothetical protein
MDFDGKYEPETICIGKNPSIECKKKLCFERRLLILCARLNNVSQSKTN